jgi:hypothetical protein
MKLLVLSKKDFDKPAKQRVMIYIRISGLILPPIKQQEVFPDVSPTRKYFLKANVVHPK